MEKPCLNCSGREVAIGALQKEMGDVKLNLRQFVTKEQFDRSVNDIEEEIDKIDSLVNSVHRIGGSLETIVGQNSRILDVLSDHGTRILTMELAPPKEVIDRIDRIDAEVKAIKLAPGQAAISGWKWVLGWVATAIGSVILGKFVL